MGIKRERLGEEAAISIEVDELFVRWMDWMDSSGRAKLVLKVGIMDSKIAKYAAVVEFGDDSLNTPARPLFGRSADEAFGADEWADDIDDVFDRQLPYPPGADALTGFMYPMLDRIASRIETNVQIMDDGFVSNHPWWIEQKKHSRVWTGYQGADRAKHKIKTPHARDAVTRKTVKAVGGAARVKHKEVHKLIPPRKRRSKPPSAKPPRVRIRESRAKEKPFRIKIPGLPNLNMDGQRVNALKRGQSKRATKTRFKPQGAKGVRYKYNRPFPR
jgi:hypothetical protein